MMPQPLTGLSTLPPNALSQPLAHQIAHIHTDWRPLLDAWLTSPRGTQLCHYLEARQRAGAVIFPAQVFRALKLTPLSQTRVVILGQDPYHGPGQADGLAFSVPQGIPIPPSLRNIFSQCQQDLSLPPPRHGNLKAWAEQGILLLNTTLTVEQSRPASHADQGWENLTDQLITAAAQDPHPKVFMLWGAHAQTKYHLINPWAQHHLVLSSNHPSPLSARRRPIPFIGNQHFKRCVEFLQQYKMLELFKDSA